MFRASSAHLQEDTVVHMQLMVLSLSMRVLGGLSVHSLSDNWLEGKVVGGFLKTPTNNLKFSDFKKEPLKMIWIMIETSRSVFKCVNINILD